MTINDYLKKSIKLELVDERVAKKHGIIFDK